MRLCIVFCSVLMQSYTVGVLFLCAGVQPTYSCRVTTGVSHLQGQCSAEGWSCWEDQAGQVLQALHRYTSQTVLLHGAGLHPPPPPLFFCTVHVHCFISPPGLSSLYSVCVLFHMGAQLL